MSETEKLRKLLDERGMAYTVHGARQTWWEHDGCRYFAVEDDGRLCVAATGLTATQAMVSMEVDE